MNRYDPFCFRFKLSRVKTFDSLRGKQNKVKTKAAKNAKNDHTSAEYISAYHAAQAGPDNLRPGLIMERGPGQRRDAEGESFAASAQCGGIKKEKLKNARSALFLFSRKNQFSIFRRNKTWYTITTTS